jgi:hypothetical protein
MDEEMDRRMNEWANGACETGPVPTIRQSYSKLSCQGSETVGSLLKLPFACQLNTVPTPTNPPYSLPLPNTLKPQESSAIILFFLSLHHFTTPHIDHITSLPHLSLFQFNSSPSTSNQNHNTANMVHLATVSNDAERDVPLIKGMENIKLGTCSEADLFTTSVYGSKFAAADLPKHEMPEHEMPKEVAYRMIKDDLSLDGNPMLK